MSALGGRVPNIRPPAPRRLRQKAAATGAALLLRHAPAPVAAAFCLSRLGAGGRMFGTLPPGADIDAILSRQGV